MCLISLLSMFINHSTSSPIVVNSKTLPQSHVDCYIGLVFLLHFPLSRYCYHSSHICITNPNIVTTLPTFALRTQISFSLLLFVCRVFVIPIIMMQDRSNSEFVVGDFGGFGKELNQEFDKLAKGIIFGPHIQANHKVTHTNHSQIDS